MAITFTPTSLFSTGFNAVIPGYGNPAPATTPSSLLTSAASPAGAPNLSSLYSTAQSQFSTTPGPLGQYQEDPRLTQMLAQLMARGNQTDQEIAAQADGAYSAQRKAADNDIQRQLTRSLAANGVLPTGGLASQYYNEVSAPVLDRLNAQRAQTELELRGQRDNVRGQATQTLAGVDGNKNQFTLSQLNAQQQAQFQSQQLAAQQAYQQAQLQQQSALASQQLAAEQARAQQQASLAQQQLDYSRQSNQDQLAFQREQAALANQRFYAGNGSATGSMGGGTFGTLGSGSVFGQQDSQNMQDNYQRMVNAERTRSGLNAQGGYAGGSVSGSMTGSQYPTASQSSQSSIQNIARSAANSITSPASNRDAFGMQSQSFYTPTSSRDAFQMPALGFNY